MSAVPKTSKKLFSLSLDRVIRARDKSEIVVSRDGRASVSASTAIKSASSFFESLSRKPKKNR